MNAPRSDAEARAAEVARASYGRLLGILAARSGDVAQAEDALSDALVSALRVWPDRGVPDNPEAWLIATARNRLTDMWRRSKRAPLESLEDDRLADLLALEPSASPDLASATPDPRLTLLFVCAHPAIDEAVRAPLMLQTVLGFTAAEIARAFVISPSALAQSLVRAKARIKANAIPFRAPEGAELEPRLTDVLEAVYGAYALSWTDSEDARQMQGEAVFLATLLADLLPEQPEAQGLAALLAFIHARVEARSAGEGWAPLDEQDVDLWDSALLARAEARLQTAKRLQRLGRFQLEAAIQSVHAARRRTGRTDWPALGALYAGLVQLYPTIGARVSQAAVMAELQGAARGLELLDDLNETQVRQLQPYWATRAHLLSKAGRAVEAQTAYDKAIALALNPGQRAWLEMRRARMATAAEVGLNGAGPRTDT